MVAPVLRKALPYDANKDFVPITTFASSGNGTGYHFAGELFASTVGAQRLHVPYRGAAPAMNDLVGGQVQVMFDSPGSLPMLD